MRNEQRVGWERGGARSLGATVASSGRPRSGRRVHGGRGEEAYSEQAATASACCWRSRRTRHTAERARPAVDGRSPTASNGAPPAGAVQQER